ncbi:hypothetical protein WJX77_002453 [Trebouxia sp. C0004]
MAALQLMTAERDGLATKLQAADFFRTATDDYLHDLLRRARIGHLRLKGKPGITASESGPWSGRNFKTNFPKANAARAKQLHAAELSDVISNLELSKQDLAHSEQARVAEADNSASLTATLQSLKSFCDSQTHKLSESCADLHISDHLRNSSEKRLEGVTAQRDRLADQVDSLRNGNYAQDREVRAVEFKCVTLRQQLAEALSGKTELALAGNHHSEAAEQKVDSTSLHADLTVVSAGKQGSERQLALLEGQNEELQHQLTAASKEAAQHATHIGRSLVAKERLQAHLTAKSKQNQQLAEKVAKLEADVSRLNGQSLQELAGLQSRLDSSLEHLRLSRAELEAMSAQTHARFEREAEQHAAFVQQLQQQRDREARAHRKEVTRLRDLLEVAHPAKSHTSETEPGLYLCAHWSSGAGKAVPAFPSPSANGVVSSGKATPANASIPGKGALPAAKASPAKPPAAGSNKAVLPALPKSPAQDKAVPSKPGSAKHGSDRQVEAGPKPGVTPLQDLSNGTKPARSSASSPLKDCAKSSHSADRKAVSDGTAATRLAGSKLDQPAAELRSSTSKESKSLTSSVLDKGKSHSSSSSSNTGMHAFSKGMSPHGLVKGRAACKSSHHPKSRRAADGSSRTVSSTGVVSAQSPPQTEHSHSAFSPFRCVTGQQAEGQQDKSKAAPQLAAMATTWSNPMFAYSTAPPSFCGAAQASSLVPDDQAKPKAHSQTEPLPLEPARQPLTTAAAAAELDKSSPALDNLIRQMQLLTIAACCASFSSEQESVLPAVADPADALQRSADAAQASSVPSGTLSSSDLNMPPKAHLACVTGTEQAQGAAATTSTDEPRAPAAGVPQQTPFVSTTKEHQPSPVAAAAAGLVMSGSAGSPMLASPSAISEASDPSHAELYAMLDAGLLESPSPSAGIFSSVAPAVRWGDVSPVPFGSLSSSNGADEDATQASAAMDIFSQAAAQPEGIPDLDSTHGVLANQMLGDVMSLDEMLVGFSNLLTTSSPQMWDASAASQEAVLQAGIDQGSLASSKAALTGAHALEFLAVDSSILDLRGNKPGVLSHMTGQEIEAILLADSP